jgi:hypothetical protein
MTRLLMITLRILWPQLRTPQRVPVRTLRRHRLR